ncbi:GDSL esterase/lipase At1g74460-like [Ipomoea triloba]|uniref:GDSL esterase/lipase At1g74460-like n=1 Tax=Ipomoea triloba TaxID=35885 RepID=UPI00125E2878|nr:GDSL esterase/lipase At1g74460-like [Ipomoea triloba]
MAMRNHQNNETGLILLVLHVFLIIVICWQVPAANAKKVETVYIFGDSTMDVGTNNHLKGSLATANNPYYGIDYPNSKSTGRFSNGYNTADYIVNMFGDYKESPPPFLSLIKDKCNFTQEIQRGVNFASGGSGILDDTGFKHFNVVIPLGKQIKQFATVCDDITKAIGQAKAQHLLQNAFYLLSVGSNDLFDYKKYGSNLTTPDFIDHLGGFLASHLEKLYHLGARKLGIIGLAPIGCCPSMRELTSDGGCVDDVNEMAENLYKATEMVLQNMSSSFKGLHYSLGNSYNMTMPVIDPKSKASNLVCVPKKKNVSIFGVSEISQFNFSMGEGRDITQQQSVTLMWWCYRPMVKRACCGHGRFNGKDKCTKKSHLCKNRNATLFFDWVHPTQMASAMAAELLFISAPPIVTPINFGQLAAIQV